jgi:hypothetical protein
MALNPSGAISLAGPSAGQSIAVELGQSATAIISLNDTNVRTLAGVASGVIVMPTDFWGKSNITGTQKAIFGFGQTSPTTRVSTTNLVSSSGVVASDTPGVGTARRSLAAAGYGGDKAIFGFGTIGPSSGDRRNVTNLVSNTGVVASDTPGVGFARSTLAAASYGTDKAIFMAGGPNIAPALTVCTNLVSNTGVVQSDVVYPTIANRLTVAGVGYGGDKGMLIFGANQASPGAYVNEINLVSNTGVLASSTPTVATARSSLAAASYGGDKAIIGFGSPTTSITNLVSNTGVVASDTPGVGFARSTLAAAGYGGDKAIFGFGSPTTSITNLVSNTGVVASNTPGVGTAKNSLAAAGYSLTA